MQIHEQSHTQTQVKVIEFSHFVLLLKMMKKKKKKKINVKKKKLYTRP